MHEEGLPDKEATRKSMNQISGDLIEIGLVLSAVFLPMAFFSGSAGVIYQQFAVTIVSAMVLSVFAAFILTPALCVTILKPVDKEAEAKGFFGWFNRGFSSATEGYGKAVKGIIKRRYVFLYLVSNDCRGSWLPLYQDPFWIPSRRRPRFHVHSNHDAASFNSRTDFRSRQTG